MKYISDIMTKNPVCCTPEMGVPEVAELMLRSDCGEIPVVYSLAEKKVLGIITDRDIVLRSIALGVNPMSMIAEECMSYPAIMVKNTTSIDDCCQLIEDNKIRSMPVIDEQENLCGIISITDIAQKTTNNIMLELLKARSHVHFSS
jgi:CBS domain-containing protein